MCNQCIRLAGGVEASQCAQPWRHRGHWPASNQVNIPAGGNNVAQVEDNHDRNQSQGLKVIRHYCQVRNVKH